MSFDTGMMEEGDFFHAHFPSNFLICLKSRRTSFLTAEQPRKCGSFWSGGGNSSLESKGKGGWGAFQLREAVNHHTVPQLPSALGELVVAVTREGRLSGKFLAKVGSTNNVHICPVQPQVCTSIVAASECSSQLMLNIVHVRSVHRLSSWVRASGCPN